MSQTTLTEDDEGKRIVDSDGNDIGIITEYRDGQAFVDPKPGISDLIMSRLGWGGLGEGNYVLDTSDVDTVTDAEVLLKR